MNSLSSVFNSLSPTFGETTTQNTSISNKHYILSSLILLVCAFAIQFYQIEASQKLPILFPFIVVSFLLHAKLPLLYRQAFLFFVNIIAIIALFGVYDGIQIIIGALSLFSILLIPLKIKYRSLLVILFGILLVFGKLGWIPGVNLSVPTTIIGGLFMFRTILFLYEIQYEKQPSALLSKLNYFFLLPNLIFIIFPVLDYKSFERNYYNVPASQNYFKGLHWIMRGLFHLMLYRIIYYYFLPSPTNVHSLFSLIQYMAVSYILIIRLSGIFHLSTGIICLFGYNLPPTFDNYFLASSFSDLWRRINIYWKDFIMKVFYYPIFFRFKKRNNWAVFFTILIVFIINWLLHQYQWFWVRGEYPIRIIDFIFWTSFGLLVAFNSIMQRKTKKKQAQLSKEFSPTNALIKSLKIMGMFTFMSIFWSFWTSPSFAAWLSLIKPSLSNISNEFYIVLLVFLSLIPIGIFLYYIEYRWNKSNKTLPKYFFLKTYSATFLIFVLLASPLCRNTIDRLVSFDLEPILEMKLNKFDQDQLFQGYYETLLVGNNFSSRMWEVQQEQPVHEKLKDSGIQEYYKGSLRGKGLKPDTSIIFKGKTLSTNEFGMRDQSYSLKKGKNTLRIALLGGSNEMGSGVGDQQNFESVLEKDLNAKENWLGYEKIEILNFAISGVHIPQQVGILEQSVLPFKPDVLFYCLYKIENEKFMKEFARLITKIPLRKYPILNDIAQKAEIHSKMNQREIRDRIQPYKQELFDWSLNRITKICEQNNITPVCIFQNRLKSKKSQTKTDPLLEAFKSKGFYILDLSDTFIGEDAEHLTVDVWDFHYSAKVHQIIANELLIKINEDAALLEAIKDHHQ